MRPIKFNKNYDKLYNQKSGKLLEVVPIIDKEIISNKTIFYDTAITSSLNSNPTSNPDDIPNGQIIRLTFIGDLGIPFTTYRKAKSWKYYHKNIGETFPIKIEEKKEKKEDETPVNDPDVM